MNAPVKKVNGKTGCVNLTPEDVGAEPEGTAGNEIVKHNTSDAAHNDIRDLIKRLESKVPNHLSEMTDDAEHRTVTDAEKAAWNSKIDKTALNQAVTESLQQAKESGEFKGDPGEKGEPGDDGHTPQKGVDYFDGADGKDGAKGADGVSITSVSIKEVQ